MRKLKGGMRGSKLFDTRIYPVVRLATKAHLHPRCWSTHKEYCFSAIKSLPRTPSPRSPWSRVPLRSFSTKDSPTHYSDSASVHPVLKDFSSSALQRLWSLLLFIAPTLRQPRRIIRSHNVIPSRENSLSAESPETCSDESIARVG